MSKSVYVRVGSNVSFNCPLGSIKYIVIVSSALGVSV